MRIHAIQDSLKPEFSRTTNTEETHTEPKDTVPSTNHADTDDDHTPHADTCHTEDHEPSREPDVVEDEAESPNRATVLEIITAPSLIMQGMCLWRWVSREPPADDAYLRIRFHTARIMVPTYKEPLEVVAGTIHEIVHMDLPPNFHIHVYVLDDGKREVLENWVLSKRTKRRVFLHYVARPKLPGVPHHAKAGNINHTLHYVFDDAYAEKECVIIFDADFMPRRNYLLQVLPVFSEKRTRPLGLVQTPQFFYNVNPDEDVRDHLNVSFFHRIEPSLDRWSAVNCCGTNFTVRADALKDVGYFPVGCLTEDTLLSLRLCTMGWGVAYHHEVLAVGQSPHELTEIFKQRSRWCKGNLQR